MINQYIRQYGTRLYGLCMTLCANPHDADDLYQETWMKVAKYISRYDTGRDFEPWLTQICVNTYRNTLRRISQCHDAGVREAFMACPKCGTKLKATCPNCSMPVEADWRVCPKCAQTLSEYRTNYTAPQQPKDNALSKILLAVILIPILLIALLLLLSIPGTAGIGASNISTCSVENYLTWKDNEEITTWFENAGDHYNTAYALRYFEGENGQCETHYVVYIPGVTTDSSSGIGRSSNIFGATITLNTNRTDSGDSAVFCISMEAKTESDLVVYCDGEKLDCEITVIDENPLLFTLESKP